MYITEAINLAKQLHPNEYSVKECVRWCDELSAEIMRNYDERFKTISCTGASSVLLPKNTDIFDIAKIIMDGKELDKTDLRDFGIVYEYTKDGRVLKKENDEASDFEIIYREPYLPIRYIDQDYSVTAYDGYFEGEDIGVFVGDTLVFDESKTVYITEIDEEKYYYEGDVLSGSETHVRREIQDETLLPPPYDSVYIDFINAKVSLYQGDSSAYASFASQYIAKLEDYARHITRNKPRVKKKFLNWW